MRRVAWPLFAASLSTNALLAYVLLARQALDVRQPVTVRQPAAAAPASAAVAERRAPAAGRLWLTVAIMTVPRKGLDYLTATLESFDHERPARESVLYDRIEVLVLNNAKGGEANGPFERLRTRFANDRFFYFATNAQQRVDRRPELRDAGDRNKPGYRVRQQTRDFAALLEVAAGRADYLMTMEDDFLACPKMMGTLQYVVDKAHAVAGDWAAVRVSYGLAGVLLRGKDVPPLAAYMLKRHEARPPDHLIVEWMAGESDESRAHFDGRRNLAFKYNLLDHIGAVSSLRSEISPSYPHCFDALQEPVLFKVEAFSAASCPYDDLWPCPAQPRSSSFGRRGEPAGDGSEFKRANRYPHMVVHHGR